MNVNIELLLNPIHRIIYFLIRKGGAGQINLILNIKWILYWTIHKQRSRLLTSRGRGFNKCQGYYTSLFSKFINERGIKNHQNLTNVVYGCLYPIRKTCEIGYGFVFFLSFWSALAFREPDISNYSSPRDKNSF